MASQNDIAIIGMSCRLPGANSVGQFWQNLVDGVESVTFFADEELLAAGVDPTLLARPDYIKAAPKLDGIDRFDAAFFGYSPKEAALIDPQQRLFLEVAWEALEHAGYCPDQIAAAVGVYAGAGSNITSYLAAHPGHPELQGQTAGIGHISNDKDFLSTRVSFKLNLTGPSLTVQTACSTSLVAVHLACQGLLNGECDMALAGASAVRIPHDSGYLAEKGGVRSRDGHCRPFDANGTGTIFGSGVVAVVLKPLDAALRDRDPVIAVVKSTCINNDGANKVSYTAPSVTGQARAMAEAFALAEVEPDSVGYVECHATGTVVGDPLEIQALTRAFRTQTDRENFCAVGSVKSNIGHPEQAAGLAALMKAALSLKHRLIPATVNLGSLNPNIPFDGSPFYVADRLLPWAGGEAPRRAAVNSLGIGGTNAFVLLEEAPPRRPPKQRRPGPQLFCLSARNDIDLAQRAAQFRELLESGSKPNLADVCYATNRSCSSLRQRVATVVQDEHTLDVFLAALAEDSQSAARTVGPRAPIAFLYSGQGAQHAGMGRTLYRRKRAFRAAFDDCDTLFSDLLGVRLRDVMFGDGEAGVDLDATRYAQPALFTFEYAMTRLWASVGIRPDAVMGHSLGEIVAACVAGALNLEDAVRLVNHRSLCMQAAPAGGAMAAVAAGEREVASVIDGLGARVEIASVNSALNTVVSGASEAVDAVLALLSEKGLKSKRLKVSHAFHSRMMEPVLDRFEQGIGQLAFGEPTLPFVSNLTGGFCDAATALDAGYWRRHLRQHVGFARGMSTLLSNGFGLFIEVGPGSGTLTMARQNAGRQPAAWVASTVPGSCEEEGFLGAVGEVYVQGYRPDWTALAEDASIGDITLPGYPFNRQSYWVETRPRVDSAGLAQAGSDELLGRPRHTGGNALEFVFSYGLVSCPELTDHRILGQPVLPTTLIVELARRAGSHRFGKEIPAVQDLVYHEAIVLPETRDVGFKLTLASRSGGGADFELMEARSGGAWQRKVSGRIVDTRALAPALSAPAAPPGELAGQADRVLSRRELYRSLARRGLDYGPQFARARKVYLNGTTSLIELDATGRHNGTASVQLDAALHAYPMMHRDQEGLWLPVRLNSISHTGNAAAARWVTTRISQRVEEEATVDIDVLDSRGRPVVAIDSMVVRQVPATVLTDASRQVFESWLYRPRWVELSRPDAGDGDSAYRLAGRDAAQLELLRAALTASGQTAVLDRGGAAGPADHVVYVADLDGIDDAMSSAGIEARVEASLRPALELAQRLVAAARDRPRVWFVTRGAQQVANERVNPATAVLWGFAQTFMQEFPQFAVSCVDLDPGLNAEEALRRLPLPRLAGLRGEDQLALRGERLYGRRFARLDDPPAPHRPPAVATDATYLITGGLGSLGLLIGRWLVERRGARSLVLVSRSKPGAAAKRAVRGLEKLGCRVTVARADVSSEADVERLFSTLRELPELRGVVHCAGVLADGVIPTLGWDDFTSSFQAKVSGTWLLHRYTRDRPLDFFILQSSILSLIGAAGQANYTAANAFLDSFASYRRNLGLAASVQNWGPWNAAGMATASGERGIRIWDARGLDYIDPREGIRIFAYLLESGIAQAAVGNIDWQQYLTSGAAGRNYYEDFAARPAPGDGVAAPDLRGRIAAEPAPERQESLLAAIGREVAAELGFEDPIDPAQPLNELGLDSLMAVSLSNRLERRLRFSVPVVEMIRGPSLNELAAYIQETLLGESTADRPPQAADSVRAIRPGPGTGRGRTEGDGWLVFPKPNPDARTRLICFHYAGGGATIYRPWAEHIGDHIELVAIEPPGRGSRAGERPISDLKQYRQALTRALRDFRDKPCALFGHCFGGLNLYETARSLAESDGSAIRHIFVSGSRPPDQLSATGPFEEELLRSLLDHDEFDPFRKFHEQSDDVFLQVIRKFDIGATDDFLAHEALRDILLPAIRADFAMAERYAPENVEPLDAPITCFQGIGDTYVSDAQAVGWSRFTKSEFRLLYRNSTHYIVVDDRRFIIDTINNTLSQQDRDR